MQKSLSVLMTGATGFLGSQVARRLLERGHHLVALCRRASILRRLTQREIEKIHWLHIEENGVRRAFETPIDVVIHTATNYGYRGSSINDILEVNLLLPLQILDYAAQHGVSLFISTDTMLTKFLNDYALTKSHLTDWGRRFADLGKIAFCNLRIEHMYGVGDNPERFTEYVIQACLKNVPHLDLTLGEQYRDFIHVSDVVEVYDRLLSVFYGAPPQFCEFEVGTGVATRVRDFVEMVHRLTESRTELRFGAVPYRLHEIMYACANIEPLKEFGWQPKVKLEDGLRQVIAAIRSRSD
ncbi:MAG: NAD(P)-dependent oxidoreductase [Methylacidiphilales bacterium]|nr:NAD(P)-dependent oxidoreductase [Candidatus Methylacidiphilales bacterium]MDW8349221.1 NAD(P)-dependent oxidoreductase [Verrucomicrobiae bacterium]